MISLKNIFKGDKSVGVLFNVFLVIVLLWWLFWFYGKVFKPISVQVETEPAPVVINIDKSAYETVEAYLNRVNSFQLPDLSGRYTNLEPFREYK